VSDAIGYYFRLEGLEPKDPLLYEEIKAFLQSVDWRPELLATYDEKVKAVSEERKKAEEETLKALEEGQGLPAVPGAPKPTLPTIPDIAGDVEGLNEGILQTEESRSGRSGLDRESRSLIQGLWTLRPSTGSAREPFVSFIP
jgi:hypothetical protein